MQYGHSKDHRPDLPQLKLMAACAEPSGHMIASDVLAGQRADDPLYVPMYKRVRDILGQSGLLYAGDTKMAALSTRAYIVAGKDDYLVPLPMTGNTATSFSQWLDAIVDGTQCATLVWEQGQLVAAGYEFNRTQSTTIDEELVTWTERVLMVRSTALATRDAKVMMKRLAQAEARLNALTPEPGRGKPAGDMMNEQRFPSRASASHVVEGDVPGKRDREHAVADDRTADGDEAVDGQQLAPR